MAKYRVQESARLRIEEIFRFTRKTWSERQARDYVDGMFDAFAKVDHPLTRSRPIPAAFGVDGFYLRYRKHYVYWRRMTNGDVGIVTVLHERMHQLDRFREDSSP